MTENSPKEVKTVSTLSPTVAVSTHQKQQVVEKQLTKITGILTSPIQLRGEGTLEPYYYSFIRLKGQKVDLPVIFKLKNPDNKLIEPQLKKGSRIQLSGHYSNSPHSIRKSFTTIVYQLLNEKIIRKKCSGCLDNFLTTQQENYDYCKKCELNGSRYSQNKCPECGDGSGNIKFPNQPPRNCKTCHLTKRIILSTAKHQLPKFEHELTKIKQIRQQLENYE